MKLIQYMRAKNLDDAAMAALVGDISAHGIKKVKYGERNPSLALALRIEAATNGDVSTFDLLAPSASKTITSASVNPDFKDPAEAQP